MHHSSEHRLPVVMPLALAAIAWIGIIVWSETPYATYLSHGALTDLSWERTWVLPLLLASWILMSAAMMLPAYVPIVARYRPGGANQREVAGTIGILVAGYLAVWALVGAGFLALDLIVHRVIERSTALPIGSWLLPGAVALAGLYQLTAVRERYLAEMLACSVRTADVIERRPLRDGLRHGLLCAGVSWPLMLLMFVVGHGNVVWMVLLGGLLTFERLFDWGRRLGPSLGPALLCAAPVLVVLGMAF